MNHRRWWALLLLVGAIAVLFGLRAVTGGRLYAGGIAPARVTAALSAYHRPLQTAVEDQEPGQVQLDSVDPADRQGRKRIQRWREPAPIHVAAAPAVVWVAIHPAAALWRPADEPDPAPPSTARRQPRHPRGP